MSALDRGDNFMDIITKDCRANVSVVISLRGPLAPGPVPAASVLAASYFNGVQQWDAGSTGGATRSVTLTSASPRITGTYAFSGMQPLAATGATGTKSVSGSFDVSFGNGTVCQ
jgi:hypothetical protein